MRKIMSMWEDLHTMGCPDLREDVELEGRLATLDLYMISCIDEFSAMVHLLQARSFIYRIANESLHLSSSGLMDGSIATLSYFCS